MFKKLAKFSPAKEILTLATSWADTGLWDMLRNRMQVHATFNMSANAEEQRQDFEHDDCFKDIFKACPCLFAAGAKTHLTSLFGMGECEAVCSR